jgi:hypothetical protein
MAKPIHISCSKSRAEAALTALSRLDSPLSLSFYSTGADRTFRILAHVKMQKRVRGGGVRDGSIDDTRSLGDSAGGHSCLLVAVSGT